jgi:hypothetical protein
MPHVSFGLRMRWAENAMPDDLDPERLDAFARRLTASSARRVPLEVIWQAFASAFPARPQGVEECRRLRAALDALDCRGTVRLPSSRGRRWESTLGVALPRSVDVQRARSERRADDWRSFPWHPALAWVTDLERPSNGQIALLRRVHEALVSGRLAEIVPIKHRSLELTGDEKGLERLMGTSLFAPGRLDVRLLGCAPDVLPLAWEEVGTSGGIVIFENAGPFTVARRVLEGLGHELYGMVGYGGGARLGAAVAHLATIDRPLERIAYVGDLDPRGLEIAHGARDACREAGLPELQPASELHRAMLAAAARLGYPGGWPTVHPRGGLVEPARIDAAVAFLADDLRGPIRAMLLEGRRIPEEVLGPADMRDAWHCPVGP